MHALREEMFHCNLSYNRTMCEPDATVLPVVTVYRMSDPIPDVHPIRSIIHYR